jgi:predicted PurR-regulated permease PerM
MAAGSETAATGPDPPTGAHPGSIPAVTESLPPDLDPDQTGPGSGRLPGLVRRAGVASWSLLGVLLLAGALIWIVIRIQILIPPMVLAIALIYVLNPVVNRLHRLGVPRILGSCLSYVVLGGLLTLAGYLVIPSITDQASDFAGSFPEIYDETAIDLENLVGGLGFDVDLPDYEEVRRLISDAETQDQVWEEFTSHLAGITAGLFGFLLVFLLAPVIALYLLMDLPKLREQATGLLPPRYRDEVLYVGRQLGKSVGNFIRGQALVAVIVGILSALGFWLIGLPFWLIIGISAGLLNIVPFVGPWVGGFLGVAVALFAGDLSLAFWAVVVAVSVQQIDNNFISPAVMRATVRIHPATVILALLVGGALAGVWGVLLAVPAVASFKIVAGHLWRTRVLGQDWQEALESMIDDGEPPPEPVRGRLRPAGRTPAGPRDGGTEVPRETDPTG